jgi:hypothetical protein
MIILWLQYVIVFHSIIFYPKSILVKNNLMSYLFDVIFDFLLKCVTLPLATHEIIN